MTLTWQPQKREKISDEDFCLVGTFLVFSLLSSLFSFLHIQTHPPRHDHISTPGMSESTRLKQHHKQPWATVDYISIEMNDRVSRMNVLSQAGICTNYLNKPSLYL